MLIRIFNTCITILLVSMLPKATYAQEKASATPTLDAMEAGIMADSRVNELKALDPEKLVSEATYAIEWPRIYEKDIYWKCRVLRTIDFRDDRNKALVASFGKRPDLSLLFIVGAMQGRYQAFSNADDRFTRKISADSLATLLERSLISETGIQKILIKQDWLYIGPQKKLVGRIIGIAPILETVAADGVTTETPLFWIYYPSIRPYLREQDLPSVDGSAANLDELFEGWRFISPIQSVRQSDQTKTMDFLSRENKERILNKF